MNRQESKNGTGSVKIFKPPEVLATKMDMSDDNDRNRSPASNRHPILTSSPLAVFLSIKFNIYFILVTGLYHNTVADYAPD